MSKWAIIGCVLGGSIVTSVAGCNIENCERGAYCGERADKDYEDENADEHEQCLHYCERLSVCGAPQARDFDECVEACEDRFDELPEETAELCACTPRSRCEDVIDGRCSDGGSGGQSGSGGTSSGGSPSQGGAYATGGSSNNGGSPETGGSSNNGGSTTGGAPSTGGAPHTGGSHSTGGSTTGGSGGSDTGGSGGGDTGGAGGEDPGTPCTCSCQCPSGESCVSGYCAG